MRYLGEAENKAAGRRLTWWSWGIRTPDLLIANETRYQLRHSPMRPIEREEEVTTGSGPNPNRGEAPEGAQAPATLR